MNLMPFTTKFLIVLFLFTISIDSFGQLTSDDERIEEINFLLNIHSLDGSELILDNYCGMLDKEENGETYQYYLNQVQIAEPINEDGNYVIDLLCNDSDKCITINRRNDHRSKDFILRNAEVANRIFELLIIMQQNCE